MAIIGCQIDESRIDGDLEKMRRDLERFSEIGLQAAEITAEGIDVIRNGKLDQRRLIQSREVLDSFELSYSVHAPIPLNLMDEDVELHLDVLRSCLSFCEAIGARTLVYHPGRFLAEEAFTVKRVSLSAGKRLTMMDNEAESLREVADEYREVCINMETARPYLKYSPYCYAERPGMLLEQAHRIDRKNVRLTLDVGHLYMASKFYGFGPVAAVRDMRGMIAHTHVHDNFGRSVFQHEKLQTQLVPFGRGDMHMPVGWGSVPIRDLLAEYADGYKGMYMMELRSRYFTYAEESFKNLRAVVRAIEEGTDATN